MVVARTVPNRRRERAREAIYTCGKVAYDQRWTRNTIPSHCTLAEGVKNYDIREIKDSIETTVCCGAANQSRQSAEVELYVYSSGDRGGGTGSRALPIAPGSMTSAKRLEDSYLIDCKDARKRLCQ